MQETLLSGGEELHTYYMPKILAAVQRLETGSSKQSAW